MDALKKRLENMLSELNLRLNELYLKYNKEATTTNIKSHLGVLEHILNIGISVLDSVLIAHQNKLKNF